MPIDYDPGAGVFSTIFSWTGTIMQLVLTKPLIWLLVSIHAIFVFLDWLLWKYDKDDAWRVAHSPWLDNQGKSLPKLSWSAGALTTSLLIFFIVFYGSQCYGRFYTLYGHCIGLGGSTMEWTALIKLHLPPNPNGRWNAVRYMLAAMHVLYFGLRDIGPTQGIDEEEWATIKNRHLLIDSEIDTLKAYKGFKPFLPVHWAMLEAEAQLKANPMTDDKSEVLLLQQMQEKAFAFRGHCGQIVNLLKQPVPFPYFHILNLMIILNLTIVAYILVPEGKFFLTGLIQFLVGLVLLGLKEVAICLADPFGDDAVDFNVDTFLMGAYKNSVAHLSIQHEACGMELPTGISNPLLETGGKKSTANV